MKKLIVVFSLLGLSVYCFSQAMISGEVKDISGNPLVGATIVVDGTYLGTSTNNEGVFSFKNLKNKTYALKVSFLGYIDKVVNIEAKDNAFIEVTLNEQTYLTEEVIVSAIRAGNTTPTTYTNIEKDEIESQNQGRDVPFLLSLQPSVVVSSDAGNGIGYTSMRIRGIDSRQINVTINGIPLNDAESHGVFWVDVPDIAGSSKSIQVQRGIGTSTNGSGAFGASINVNTDNFSVNPFATISSAYGSFNSKKLSVSTGTGLIHDHWFLEGKYAMINSDGYRDRSSSDLKSYFVQGGYYTENTILKAVAFGGREETYQAWYSTSQDEMDWYGRTFNSAGAIYNDDWSINSYYDNFIDHYSQDHFQLHWIQKLTSNLTLNAALHYTYGRGYYEEYMQEELMQYYDMPYYGLEPLYFGLDSVDDGNGKYEIFYHDTVNYSDVIRRLWLDNDFYGGTWSLKYAHDNLSIIYGGAYNKLADGQHFGELIWARFASNSLPGHEFYRNLSEKTDLNSFVKANYTLFGQLSLFADLQVRNITYTANGYNREWDDRVIDIDKTYTFFNPKFGAYFDIGSGYSAYTSFAIANREPNRSDFLDAPNNVEPKPEKMGNLELGIRSNTTKYAWEVVLYNMNYKNQLVMTGKLNDVGTPIRKNTGESYRRGIECSAAYKPISILHLNGNVTLSENKTSYKQYNSDDSTFVNFNDVDIAYSPFIIASGQISVIPVKNLSTGFIFKHVGSQFVDNTENDTYKLPAYSLLDFKLSYQLDFNKAGNLDVNFFIYNLTNLEYSSHAVVRWDDQLGYFPQAGINYLCGVTYNF